MIVMMMVMIMMMQMNRMLPPTENVLPTAARTHRVLVIADDFTVPMVLLVLEAGSVIAWEKGFRINGLS